MSRHSDFKQLLFRTRVSAYVAGLSILVVFLHGFFMANPHWGIYEYGLTVFALSSGVLFAVMVTKLSRRMGRADLLDVGFALYPLAVLAAYSQLVELAKTRVQADARPLTPETDCDASVRHQAITLKFDEVRRRRKWMQGMFLVLFSTFMLWILAAAMDGDFWERLRLPIAATWLFCWPISWAAAVVAWRFSLSFFRSLAALLDSAWWTSSRGAI